MKICMLVKNDVTKDARVRREARTLARHGFDVVVIGALKPGSPEQSMIDGFTITRIPFKPSILPMPTWIASRALKSDDVSESVSKRARVLRFLFSPVTLPVAAFIGIGASIVTVLTASVQRTRGIVVFIGRQARLRRIARCVRRFVRAASVQDSRRGQWVRLLTRLLRWLRVWKPLRKCARFLLRWAYKSALQMGRKLLRWVPIDHTYSLSWAKAAVATQADIYTAHDLNTLRIAADAARATGARLIYDSHEYYMGRNKVYWDYTWPKNLRYHFLEKRYIHQADAVITVSAGIVGLLESRYAISKPRLVRNVPERVAASHTSELSELIVNSGHDAEGKFLMLSVGRITTGRGIETIIQSMRLLPDHALAVFLGYGSDEMLRLYQRMVESMDIADKVAFVGSVEPEDVLSVMRGGHLSLVTVEAICESYKYALPNKLFESIHAGLPIVGSSLPCIRQIICEHEVGTIFEEGNPQDLAEKINRMMDDEQQRKRFARNAELAARVLSWEEEQKQLVDVYRQVLQGWGR